MLELDTIVSKIIGDMEELDDGEDTPTTYFNQVLWELPEIYPMGDKALATVEATDEPTFYYGPRGCKVRQDTNITITIICQGIPEVARPLNYQITKVVKDYLTSNHTFGGLCTGSTIEEVIYGYTTSVEKNLISASRIILMIKE